jgi:hypothetical protein
MGQFENQARILQLSIGGLLKCFAAKQHQHLGGMRMEVLPSLAPSIVHLN